MQLPQRHSDGALGNSVIYFILQILSTHSDVSLKMSFPNQSAGELAVYISAMDGVYQHNVTMID